MSIDRKYLVCALIYALVGVGVGIRMSASQNFSQHPTHAHILLVGFVVSLVYGVIHKLWLGETESRVATTQFVLHQVGAVTMFVGLFLLFGNLVPEVLLEPILAIASIAILLAILLMLFMVFKTNAMGHRRDD